MLKSRFAFLFLLFIATFSFGKSFGDKDKDAVKPGNKIEKRDKTISIYTPSGMEFVLMHVEKAYIPNKASFFDIWHLWQAYENINGERKQKIIQSGEWETAIKLKAGFVGGALHGFERKKSVQFYLDGKPIREDALVPLSSFTEFTIVQISDLYAYNSVNEKIAEITKRWEFGRKSEIKLAQTVHWLKAQSLETAYLSMFPIIRDNDGEYVSNKATRSDIDEVVEVSQSGEVGAIGSENKSNKTNSMKVWGDKYAFSLKVKRKKRLPNSSIWLWAPKQYNKIYFDYSGEYEVKAGEEFQVASTYTFMVKGE